jgi:uncharacterized protein (DUF488 family)
MTPGERHLFTIGHSNHPLEKFIALLRRHGVEVVVDTRSQPYSRHAPHFNRDALRAALAGAGIRYSFLGEELGGRPRGEEYYDAEGHVRYDRVAAADFFQSGIARVKRGAAKYRLALLCAEENPEGCHRRLLIARVLCGDGFTVDHIRGDGRLEREREFSSVANGSLPTQGTLFDVPEERPWRSIRSVLPRRALPNSSRPSGAPGSGG